MSRLSLIFFFFLALKLHAQERCPIDGTYFEKLGDEKDRFETWIADKRTERKVGIRPLQTKEVLQIPVVFHIIHNGEPVGSGTNIADERILQQIQILNEDFRRTNSDRILTPEEFLPVAADTEIEFVLARQDPEGLPTSGITRKIGAEPSYNFSEDNELKAEINWPAEDYLNIYVAELIGYLGWASFPFSGLEGLDDKNNNRLTDGVALDYQYVGINPDATIFESYGRTGTHEIGHFLGLKHVWGDGGCLSDDFCEDTPMQSGSYINSCPSTPQFSCESSDMYSNYLNYTEDACMNIFTQDQKERMRIVLENSPRRKSLLSSQALVEPVIYANDLGVKEITMPTLSTCETTVTPVVEVRNYGNNTITSFDIELWQNGSRLEGQSMNIVLQPLDVALVNFSEIVIDPTEAQEFSFQIAVVNGGQDGNAANNTKNLSLPPFEEYGLPYLMDFEGELNTQARLESGDTSSWTVVEAPNTVVTNKAAKLQFYNKQSDYGEFDYLITPVFDLSGITSAELSFKYAYAPYPGNTDDGLIVAISTNCGEDFPKSNRIFERYGSSLATTSNSELAFVPVNSSQWDEITINVTPWIGSTDTRIAFIGQNGSGNNIYIDDIALNSTALKAYDIGISDVRNLSPLVCERRINPVVAIKNFGYQPLDSFNISLSIEGSSSSESRTVSLKSGESTDVLFDIDSLTVGEYDIIFSVSDPNNQPDEQISNNSVTYQLRVDDAEESLPIRQNFDTDDEWFIGGVDHEPIWNYYQDRGNLVLRANGYDTETLLSEHWLISPTLKSNNFDEASLRFRYSYASRANRQDRLKILLSISCGERYEYVIFDRTSDELTELISDDPHVPSVEDWQDVFIDISDYLISDQLRLAFVFINGYGNDLFIDDIEILNTNDPDQPVFEKQLVVYPNPAESRFQVKLDLKEKQPVTISLVDMSGRVVVERQLNEGLNQVLSFDTPAQGGFYFVRLYGKDLEITRRLFIRR